MKQEHELILLDTIDNKNTAKTLLREMKSRPESPIKVHLLQGEKEVIFTTTPDRLDGLLKKIKPLGKIIEIEDGSKKSKCSRSRAKREKPAGSR